MKLCVENEVLKIRQFIESDLDDFSSIVANPISMKYCPTGKLNRQQAEMLFVSLDNYEKNNVGGLWAIEDKGMSKVIGLVGLQECAVENELFWVFQVSYATISADWPFELPILNQ